MSLPAKPGAQSRLSPDARSKRELCHGQTTWPSAYLSPPGPFVRGKPRCGQRFRAAHNESPTSPTTMDLPAASRAWSSPSAKSATLPTLTRPDTRHLLVSVLDSFLPVHRRRRHAARGTEAPVHQSAIAAL